MESLLNWVSSVDKLIGFILLLITVSGGVFAWVQRRGRSFVGEEVAPLRSGQLQQAERLEHVERRIDRVDEHLSQLEERTGAIERSLPGLATKEDLSAIRVTMAELGATVVGVGNKVDTLYRAALAVSRREDG